MTGFIRHTEKHTSAQSPPRIPNSQFTLYSTFPALNLARGTPTSVWIYVSKPLVLYGTTKPTEAELTLSSRYMDAWLTFAEGYTVDNVICTATRMRSKRQIT
ncbi:hypothetical protein PILCRDRAFT_89126 [Piloderma croceum F 1598]|uniref:Uncharacterized protein n=1 Tax=Piloderma croceum (strain F 1598) TaxID=765440 RepID=A0A0C3F9P0_PILCF|nr:hypothetical protein PILCRDRAFT_89126 [Piloderma croceum F 1598]